MHKHALQYAARGFRVLPLNGKVPRNMNGCHGATTGPDSIGRWWGQWPEADIGIATGDELVVLDVDPRHGGDRSLAELEDEHGIIRTLTARTGGGGLHLYLAGELPARSGFRPGLDLKAAGGYVVAPPSMHASGRRYEWVDPADLPTEPQPAPGWLAELVNPPARQTVPTAPGVNAPENFTEAKASGRFNPPRDVSTRYIVAAIEEECEAVATAAEGERNDTLNAAAYALARFAAAGEADAAAIREALTLAARHAGLPDFEIRRTIASAFKARRAA